jgi:hypothetical protein
MFSKIRGDIHESRCTTGINDTSGKISAGINNAGGKFATGVDTLLPVSATPATNLPLASLTLVANNGNNIRLQIS